MSDQFTPTMIVNQALGAAGIDFVIGDIEEGTRAAQIALQHYNLCRQQLLRAAHWDWARKEAFLHLVADASGQTAGNNTLVPAGFIYAYAWPSDCMKVRYIPANWWGQNAPVPTDNIVPSNSSSPLMTNMGAPPWAGQRIVPTRFLISSTPNYIPDGASNAQPGVSPIGQTIICSNLQFARCVYTFDGSYPNLWDSLFRDAMVAYLAAQLALPLAKDKRVGLEMRRQNIEIAKQKVSNARATNGNETWASSDLSVDWMRFRQGGAGSTGYGWGNNWGAGPGYLFGGYDSIAFGTGNDSAY